MKWTNVRSWVGQIEDHGWQRRLRRSMNDLINGRYIIKFPGSCLLNEISLSSFETLASA